MKPLLALVLILSTPLTAFAQDAEKIMENVRQVAALQNNQALQGNIRKKSSRTPVSLFLEGGNIQFALNGGRERFHLRLNKNDQDLLLFNNGGWEKFPPQKLVQPIAGSDMTYEDLALKFLYWPNPRIVGQEKISMVDAWRIHIVNPDRSGRYREVSVWVAKKQMALMKVTAYNAARQPVKQFEITDIMTVNNVTTVEKMKVSTVVNGRIAGSTYMEFDKPTAIKRR